LFQSYCTVEGLIETIIDNGLRYKDGVEPGWKEMEVKPKYRTDVPVKRV